MKISTEEIKAKGKQGETKLNEWLRKNGFCYVYLSQEVGNFSSLFPDAVKRPDFLVLIESVGLIAVDAKNYKLSGGVFTLGFKEELLRVLAFERLFRIPIWYAYKGGSETSDEEIWYWISALKALEVGDERSSNGEKFLAIKLEHFSAISTGGDMAKLYTQRHKKLTFLSEAYSTQPPTSIKQTP